MSDQYVKHFGHLNDFNDDFSLMTGWPKYITSSCRFSDFTYCIAVTCFSQGDINSFAIHLKYTKTPGHFASRPKGIHIVDRLHRTIMGP